ncbi:hypothetical protein BGZ80_005415 [Entomortierella chlamydospora]|uniref:Aldose 1-epimerase n=1 Tax=Entomortierella chlamydospora TaxID=101097 RepID=A0A9P6MZI5_9FUNG|nr:hypothetical protein BGZ79_002722 [Entomortierella chlamydospora]KAG0019687.1 hypothetical protein BGZ80_005415 [Entomortierella chlamydospora]
MPVKTTTFQTSPVLVQQHNLSIELDSALDSKVNIPPKARVISATILTFGAALTHLTCFDRWNQPQDVVLGFDHWQDYLAQAEPGALNPYFGSIIGRTASRIARASFILENQQHAPSTGEYGRKKLGSVSETYFPFSTSLPDQSVHALKVSNGVDCHHGGPCGFDKQHWTTICTSDAEQKEDDKNECEPFVTLQLVSPHGQNGYPGRLVTTVKYQLTKLGELVVEYWARLETDSASNSTKDEEFRQLDLHSTIVSLTNHTYWNLDGVLNPHDNQFQDLIGEEEVNPLVIQNACSVKDHTLWLGTSKLVELGEQHPVPTGRIFELSKGSGTGAQGDKREILDFSSSSNAKPHKRLGLGLDQIPGGYGYDHVYALGPPASMPQSVSDVGIQGYFPFTPHVATLKSPRTGIRLDISTSEPALVLYAAGYLDQKMLPRTKSRSFGLPTSSSTFFISPSATPLERNDTKLGQEGKSLLINAEMGKFAGVCLEPIRYPDAIHHPDWRNMVILHHDQVYRQKSVYKFSVEL